MLFLKWNNLF